MEHFDLIIVGGGIVGLATAYQAIQEIPATRLLILEKEAAIATHQTDHNSGVLHSGIYYRPGSLRALNCRTGKQAMERFCAQHAIPYELCGKVIVAVTEQELPLLATIYERGQANGVRCEMIDQTRLAELEPHACGLRAIHVPEAGIVNFRQVALKLADLILARGGTIRCQARVNGIRSQSQPVVVESTTGDFTADYVVTCAGLHSDRVAELSGERIEAQILPFRGEFYELTAEARHFCRNLIYPVPDPNFPFLGVHFTRRINGNVECGPNAVLAFAREGYRGRTISPSDLWEAVTYGGFLRLAARNWRAGLGEMWRSANKQAFVKALSRLIPEIRAEHLLPAPAGVRAQAVGRDGRLIDDFLIRHRGRVINVCNAPSPAATASLNIGRIILEKLVEAGFTGMREPARGDGNASDTPARRF
jgi:L-2-hydroxyglutarate oxidase LhgO